MRPELPADTFDGVASPRRSFLLPGPRPLLSPPHRGRHTIRAILTAALLGTPAAALAADEPSPRIVVFGTGSVQTPPDRAIVAYGVRGEGTTSDAAVTALVEKRRAIDAGVAALHVAAEVSASRVSVAEVRSPECRQGYNAPQLSTGPCAILGYIAELQVTVRTGAVGQVGTMVGLLGRSGAGNPRLEGFDLTDARVAQGAAIGKALADARAKAQAIAQGTGVPLGRLLSATNTGGYQADGDIVMTANRIVYTPAPPPPPPIAVDLTPQPIVTRAQVTVTYAIGS